MKQTNSILTLNTTQLQTLECFKKNTKLIQLLKTGNTARIRELLQEIQTLWHACDLKFVKRQANFINKICVKRGIPFDHHCINAKNADINNEDATLEKRYAIDPSNYSLAISLALSMKKNGQSKRSKQLLERVAASGYPERAKANQLLQHLFKDTQHAS
jgi:hypothetical protein